MMLVIRMVTRPIEIGCPRCPNLLPDEKHLLRAAKLSQAGNFRQADRLLQTTLLSAQGAEFAIGPREALDKLFTRARLFLSHCRFTGDD